MFKRLNPEMVLGALFASLFWTAVLGWQASYAPTEIEKQDCYEAAKKAGHKTEECKTLWEKTTTEPVALFTLILAFTTLGLWTATIGLYLAGRKASEDTRRIGEAQVRAYVNIKAASIDFMWDAIVPRVAFVASNSGQSPARNFIWNMTLQYRWVSGKPETIFHERWLESTGMDIPAASDSPPEAALIPLPIKLHIEAVAPELTSAVVRLKVDFRYTDVFDRDWFGEAYFAGVINKRPAKRGINPENRQPGTWTGQLAPMARPRDWSEVGKATEV